MTWRGRPTSAFTPRPPGPRLRREPLARQVPLRPHAHLCPFLNPLSRDVCRTSLATSPSTNSVPLTPSGFACCLPPSPPPPPHYHHPPLACRRRSPQVLRLECATPFTKPVDPQAFPDYASSIQQPMDLGTVMVRGQGGRGAGVGGRGRRGFGCQLLPAAAAPAAAAAAVLDSSAYCLPSLLPVADACMRVCLLPAAGRPAGGALHLAAASAGPRQTCERPTAAAAAAALLLSACDLRLCGIVCYGRSFQHTHTSRGSLTPQTLGLPPPLPPVCRSGPTAASTTQRGPRCWPAAATRSVPLPPPG